MSAYTTLYISRSKAIEIQLRELLGSITNEQLEGAMDDYLRDGLYNCIIVQDGCENDDHQVY